MCDDVCAIILAHGKSTRFGEPKSSLTLGGETLEKICYDKVVQFVPPSQIKIPKEQPKCLAILSALSEYIFFDRRIVQRVLLVEAARPFTPTSLMLEVLLHLDRGMMTNAVVVGLPAIETTYRVGGDRNVWKIEDRKEEWTGQTPEAWYLETLWSCVLESLQRGGEAEHSYARILLERYDNSVAIVEGEPKNFKITYPIDYELAKVLYERERINAIQKG